MNSIERGWYNGSLANYLLLPLSLLFWLISSLRRLLFKLGISQTFKAKRPVIIVGNISVGGNGKTPFTIWLVEMLLANGIKPGVISRGYGGNAQHYPIAVDDSLDTSKFGDEPVLIHQRTGCPVVVGSDRVKSCELLVSQFDCDVIISDDGLQHYRLQRDIEVVIVDAVRAFGNGWLMPVGPLRELTSRLKQVDYVIYNGKSEQPLAFELVAGKPTLLVSNNTIPGHINIASPINAVCAIGNPARFATTLKHQGIAVDSFTSFVDHHKFAAADFANYGEQAVLMTEKDAVKCQQFAQPNWWYLPVDAKFSLAFEQQFLTHIQQVIKQHGI